MADVQLTEKVANIDLDGTLAAFMDKLLKELNRMRSPDESEFTHFDVENPPEWLDARMDYIKQHPGFWANLEVIPEGMRILEMLKDAGLTINILTKGPRKATNAWTEKLLWVQRHVGEGHMTLTTDKGLVYGRLLFDDFPPYILRWLEWRPRGVVLMLDSHWNKDFRHPSVVRVGRIEDGTFDQSLPAVEAAIKLAVER